MRNALTKADVLGAIPRAAHPSSNYIIDQIHRDYRARVASGWKGHPPRSSIILTRLKQLEADGLLTRSQLTSGYYGYTWGLTDAGKAAIANLD